MNIRQMLHGAVIVVLCSSAGVGQQVVESSQNDSLFDVPYVVIHRRGENEGLKLYKPKMVTEFGTTFLKGQSSSENPREHYLVAWSSVEMIRQPNSEYRPGAKVVNGSDSDEDLPIGFRLKVIEKQIAKVGVLRKELAFEIAKKRSELHRLESKLESIDDEEIRRKTELDTRILREEINARVQHRTEAEAESEAKRIEYYRLLRDASGRRIPNDEGPVN